MLMSQLLVKRAHVHMYMICVTGIITAVTGARLWSTQYRCEQTTDWTASLQTCDFGVFWERKCLHQQTKLGIM